MRRRPPGRTRIDTLFPYTTPFRSQAGANHRDIVSLAVAIAERRQIVEQVGEIDVGGSVRRAEAVDLQAVLDRPVAALVLGFRELDRLDVETAQRRQWRGKLAVTDRRIADRLHLLALGQRGTRRAVHLRRCSPLRTRG